MHVMAHILGLFKYHQSSGKPPDDLDVHVLTALVMDDEFVRGDLLRKLGCLISIAARLHGD